MPEDKYVAVHDGLSLHYVDWGGPERPPLLLLHGLQDCGHEWDPFAAKLADEYHVVALDHRGHGDSDHTKDGLYHLSDYVAEIGQVMEGLGLRDPVIMGHSAGGKNAFIYAAGEAPKLKKLVIVDMDPDSYNPGSRDMFSRYVNDPEEWPDVESVMERLRLREPNASDERLHHNATVLTKEVPAGRAWKRDRNVMANYERPDAWEYLPKVRVPSLIVRGADSTLLRGDVARRMQALIPDCRLVELDGGGHWGHEENEQAFEKAVREFLTS